MFLPAKSVGKTVSASLSLSVPGTDWFRETGQLQRPVRPGGKSCMARMSMNPEIIEATQHVVRGEIAIFVGHAQPIYPIGPKSEFSGPGDIPPIG